MRSLNGRELKALFTLSVVVPISLLVMFRITGILPEPSKPETFMAEAVEWNFERPSVSRRINETVENSYSNEDVSIVFSIYLENYIADSGPPFGTTADATNMLVSIKASVLEGFVENINTIFSVDNELAYVNIMRESYSAYYETLNVSVKKRVDYITNWWELENDTKGFISAIGSNQPSDVSFGFPASWVLKDEGNETTEIMVVGELTYRTENSYGKVVLPIQLRLFSDDNNSFETADEIEHGSHKAWIGGLYDPVDYYTVWLEQEQMVQVELAYPLHDLKYVEDPQGYYHTGLDMYIYNPNRELKVSLLYKVNATRKVTFVANSTGWWYIQIDHIVARPIYLLNLSILSIKEGG